MQREVYYNKLQGIIDDEISKAIYAKIIDTTLNNLKK